MTYLCIRTVQLRHPPAFKRYFMLTYALSLFE